MAELRCPNCGRDNPDILDVCQFCQTPLRPDSVLRIGEKPTKKNTGELESVLPDWLKDVRQQARDIADEEAAQAANQPKSRNDEPPDLLAGLVSQAGSADEEEVPDWLANINPESKPKSAAPSTPPPEADFFAQFNRSESQPPSEPAGEDTFAGPGSQADQSPSSEEKDELSAWFTQASGQPEDFIELDPHEQQQIEKGWGSVEFPLPSRQEPAPKEEEDLSWLHNLEETAKQTGDLKAPRQNMDWMANPEAPSTPSASQEDLSWLNNLSGIEEAPRQPLEQNAAPKEDLSWLDQFDGAQPRQPSESAEEKPSGAQEDLGWLKNLGDTSRPSQPHDAAPDQPIPPQPFVSEEDLSWLNSLGGTPESARPFSTPAPEPSEKPFAKEDLSWLNNLGAAPEQPADRVQPTPSSAQEDLSWLKDFGEDTEPLPKPPFVDTGSLKEVSPRQTAPLEEKENQKEAEPDWLKSAIEAPSMPAPGDVSMEWFSPKDQPADKKPLPAEEATPSAPQPPAFSDLFSTPAEPSSLSGQDVDSLFAKEMPDWLSRSEPEPEEPVSPQAVAPPAEGPESLAPVDLPSWVQAMRPVEAMISETAPSVTDEPEETEGPLTGLRGVIPSAPISFVTRPKAISLKLQATDEQQASAALLEQILGSETSPRALVSSSFIASQHLLRWILAGIFLLVLGAAVSLRSQNMPVSASLPVEGAGMSSVVMGIPAGSNVLVVIDYEPALAAEMEAIGGPLLDQMVSLSHPNLSFVSTSPNGTALSERLLTNAKINTPDGFGYQAGLQYRNLGFLPGGAAGVLGFVERPGQIIPASEVGSFADYAALIIMTDHAESGRVWVEQLQNRKQIDPLLAGQPLLMVASAQAGPLLQPYVSSGQISGMISGLSDAARYEFVNNSRPGMARSYWDTFGIGLMMSIAMIVVGSLWSLFTGIRARRAETEPG